MPEISASNPTTPHLNPERLIHKEARVIPLPSGETRWETRCGLIMDNSLQMVHPLEDMARAATNPHVLARKQVPCVSCMNDDEKAKVIDMLLEDPETRAQTLEKMDRITPGNPHIELALAYETNNKFREWLHAYTWENSQDFPRGQ